MIYTLLHGDQANKNIFLEKMFFTGLRFGSSTIKTTRASSEIKTMQFWTSLVFTLQIDAKEEQSYQYLRVQLHGVYQKWCYLFSYRIVGGTCIVRIKPSKYKQELAPMGVLALCHCSYISKSFLEFCELPTTLSYMTYLNW